MAPLRGYSFAPSELLILSAFTPQLTLWLQSFAALQLMPELKRMTAEVKNHFISRMTERHSPCKLLTFPCRLLPRLISVPTPSV
jgi:hypothetical protein